MVRLKTTRTTAKRRLDSSRKQILRRLDVWWDPFPLGFGTLPEKMVYAKLSALGIPFQYLNDIRFNDPSIDFDKTYQADFIIPSVKIIIEVQGAHWHSMPSAIEADSYKFAVYESFGYKALAWWDYDIFSRLDDLIASEPLLVSIAKIGAPLRSTELPAAARTKTDTSKGIRTLNQKKRKPYRTFVGTKRSKLRRSKYNGIR